MIEAVIKEMIVALKKAPELTNELLEQQVLYHKAQLLRSLDAVPMELFEHQVNLLRQVMLKLKILEEKMDALDR